MNPIDHPFQGPGRHIEVEFLKDGVLPYTPPAGEPPVDFDPLKYAKAWLTVPKNLKSCNRTQIELLLAYGASRMWCRGYPGRHLIRCSLEYGDEQAVGGKWEPL